MTIYIKEEKHNENLIRGDSFCRGNEIQEIWMHQRETKQTMLTA